MENFIGVWWSGSEQDVRPAGQGAHGYKSLAMHGTGRDYPVYDDIQEYVIDRGLAAGTGDEVGTVLYSRGMYAAMLAVEAARTAQELHGTDADHAGDDARRHGQPGHHRGADGRAGPARLRPRLRGQLPEPRRLRRGDDPAVGRQRPPVEPDHRLDRAGPRADHGDGDGGLAGLRRREQHRAPAAWRWPAAEPQPTRRGPAAPGPPKPTRREPRPCSTSAPIPRRCCRSTTSR
jgi:hypothetical protein